MNSRIHKNSNTGSNTAVNTSNNTFSINQILNKNTTNTSVDSEKLKSLINKKSSQIFPDINSRISNDSSKDFIKSITNSEDKEVINKHKLRKAFINNKISSIESGTENTDNSIIPHLGIDLPGLKEIEKYLKKKENKKNGSNQNIMNIVNNVNPTNTDKNIEINFNQYEIKIVPDKNKKNADMENDTSLMNSDNNSNNSVENKEIIKSKNGSKTGSKYTDKDEVDIDKNSNKKQLLQIEKNLSLKNSQSNSQPTKIVINRANSKKIVLKINNQEKMDNFNIEVNQSPKKSNENISINFKKNVSIKDVVENDKKFDIVNENNKIENSVSPEKDKVNSLNNEKPETQNINNKNNIPVDPENKSHNNTVIDTDSSLDIIKRNKQQFLDRRIVVPGSDSDNNALDHVDHFDPIHSVGDSAIIDKIDESIVTNKLIEDLTEKVPSVTKSSAKNILKMHSLNDELYNKSKGLNLKPLKNKNFIRQLTKISELSHKFSNSNNSFESNNKNKIIKIKTKRNESREEQLGLGSSNKNDVEESEKKASNNQIDNKGDLDLIAQEELAEEEVEQEENIKNVQCKINEEGFIQNEANHFTSSLSPTSKKVNNLGYDSNGICSSEESFSLKGEKDDVKNMTQYDIMSDTLSKPLMRGGSLNTDKFKNVLSRSILSFNKNTHSFIKNEASSLQLTHSVIENESSKSLINNEIENHFIEINENSNKEKMDLMDRSLDHIILKIENNLEENFKKKRLKLLYKKLSKGFKGFNGISSIFSFDDHNRTIFVPEVYEDYKICTKKQFSDYFLNKYHHIDPLQNILVDDYLLDDFDLPDEFNTNKNIITLIDNFSLEKKKELINTPLKNSKKFKSKIRKFTKYATNEGPSCTYLDYMKNFHFNKIHHLSKELGYDNLSFYNKFLKLDLPDNHLEVAANTNSSSVKHSNNKFNLVFQKKNTLILDDAFKRKSSRLNTFVSFNNKDKGFSSRALPSLNVLKGESEISSELDGNKSNNVDNHLTLVKRNENKRLTAYNNVRQMNKSKINSIESIEKKKNTTTANNNQIDNYSQFFPRRFSILSNNDYLFTNNNKTSIIDNAYLEQLKQYLSRRRLTLMNSPLKSIKNTFNFKTGKKAEKYEDNESEHAKINAVRYMNKESMLFRTHEIKSKLLQSNNDDPKQSLFFYIKDDNFQKFKEILENKKIWLEERDKEGNTLLNLAVQCNSYNIVEYLINIGANVNSQNNRLNTPLHYALSDKNFKIADLLIRRNADENLRNKALLTPWQCIANIESIV